MGVGAQPAALAGLAIAAFLTGRVLVGVLGLRRLAPLRPESAAAATVLGAAAWTVAFALASDSGRLAARPALVTVAGAFAALAAVARWRGVRVAWRPSGSPAGWAVLGGAALLLSSLALLPALRSGGYLAGNDTFEYCSLADRLQESGLGVPARAAPERPIEAVLALRQSSSVALGAANLLALATAAADAPSSAALYPAVSAFGLLLCLLGLVLASRALARASWPVTAAVAFGFALAPHAAYWAHHNGFLSQTHAAALLLAGLVALDGGRALRRRSDGLLLAVLAAALLLVYLPFAALLGAAAAAYAAAPAGPRAAGGRAVVGLGLVGLGLVALGSLALTGFDAVSPVRGLIHLVQSRGVGTHVPLPALGFAAIALGPGLELTADVPRAVSPQEIALAAFPALLAGAGLAARWRSPHLRGLLAALAALLLLLCRSALMRDPWSGARGQTWTLFKTAQWAFPLLLVAQAAGLGWLAARARPALALFAVVCASPAPGHLAFSRVAGGGLAGLVDGARPLETLPRVAERLRSLPPGRILFLGQGGAVSPLRPGYAALLARPREVLTDWVWSVSVPVDGQVEYSEAVGAIGSTPLVPVLVDAPPFDRAGRRDLGGGFSHLVELDRPRLVQVTAPGSWRDRTRDELRAVVPIDNRGRTKLALLVPRAGRVEVTLALALPPGPHSARVSWIAVPGAFGGDEFRARARALRPFEFDAVRGRATTLRIEAVRGMLTLALTAGTPVWLTGIELR